MKFRTGFVSNSSSSSFIVAFSKDPESKEELHRVLFGLTKTWTYGEEKYPTRKISNCVWGDILREREKSKSRNTVFRGIINCHGGTFWTPDPHCLELVMDGDRVCTRPLQSNVRISSTGLLDPSVSLETAAAWEANHEGFVFYVFTYGDESGKFFSMMEHSGIFRNTPHIQISHH